MGRGLAVGVGAAAKGAGPPPPAAREHLAGTSIYQLPAGTRTGKFPFLCFGSKKQKGLRSCSTALPRVLKGVTQGLGRPVCARERPCAWCSGLGTPWILGGGAVAPLSGGRLRQQEGVSGFHERRWPCDFFPIQAHLPGLSDSLTSSCLGRRRVAPDPTMPLGAGWEPRNTLHRGLLQK